MILETHHLTIGYAAPRRAPVVIAADLNVSLAAGELVALIGPNGAGKSTLIRTLTGMQPPLEGSIRVMGDDLHALKPRTLAQRVAVVLTERPSAPNLTGYALVALGRQPHTDWTGALSPDDEQAVHDAVDAVGAADIADRLLTELSDGQQQKLLIARALAQDTPLIVLDEPTAFLDLPRRVEVTRLLGRLARDTGRAVLLSTHDLDLALRTADRIWLMSTAHGIGGLVSGAPEDLVLSGAFEAAFAADGITFDPATGAFVLTSDPRGVIALDAPDPLAAIWTARALERAGFRIKPDAAVRVTVREKSGGHVWHLSGAGESGTFGTLAALVKALDAVHVT